MSVLKTDMLCMQSATGASAGGIMANVPIVDGVKNNLFPQENDAIRVTGGTVVKKWFLFNNSLTETLVSPSVWILSEPASCTEEWGLGFDHANDDDPAQGNMTALSTSDTLTYVSSAADGRVVTTVGLDGTGLPVTEAVTLTGTTPVVGTQTFGVVYGCHLASSGSQTVVVKETTSTTTIGTVGPSKVACWLWMTPLDKGSGFRFGDVVAQADIPFWDRIAWPAGAAGERPANPVAAWEEN